MSSSNAVQAAVRPRCALAFYGVCVLMVVRTWLAFYNRGATGAAEIVWTGGVLVAINALLLVVVLANARHLNRSVGIVVVVIAWLGWMVITSVNLVPGGAYVAIKGLSETVHCPLVFLCFYVWVRSSGSIRGIVRFFLLLLVVVSVLFVLVYQYRSAEIWRREYEQLNEVYYVMLLIPFALIVDKGKIRTFAVIMISAIVSWSLKRTAFFATILALASYFMVEGIVGRGRQHWGWLVAVTFVIVGLVGVFVAVEGRTGGVLATRLRSMADDQGSGRLEIYQAVWESQKRATLAALAVGHGHEGVVREEVYIVSRPHRTYALSAHNDWQEVLFDYGIPGLVLYVGFHITILVRVVGLIRLRSALAAAAAASYGIFFVMSCTSHLVLYPTYFAFLMAFWGTIFAVDDRQQTLSVVHGGKAIGYVVGAR